jgi:hypothetical protein
MSNSMMNNFWQEMKDQYIPNPESVSEKDELKECVKEFFDSYLNYIEETDSGKKFRPIEITCCRAMMLGPLDQLLTKMATLSGTTRVKING